MSHAATATADRASDAARAFSAVLAPRPVVTWKELPVFLAQVILQPLFLLFVFGKVLGSLGYTQHGYADLLFPGLLALTAVITGMQTLAFPLVIEFGWTKEIEDRLLAPMSTALVAAEKVAVRDAARAHRDDGDDPGRDPRARVDPVALERACRCSCSRWCSAACSAPASASCSGRWSSPQRINIVFSLVFTPLLFTGCSQYPWPSLSRLPWFQVVTAVQPDDLRQRVDARGAGAEVPHIAPWVCILVLAGSIAALMRSACAASTAARSTERSCELR